MGIITDCLERIPNHFDLARVAGKRARQLARGAESTLPWDSHKSTVLALKEIAAGHVSSDILKEIDLPFVAESNGRLDALDLLNET